VRDWLLHLAKLAFGRPCPHIWRPAKTSNGLARYCDLCEVTEQLEPHEYYAYFGLIPR
jgi:hypothetical protein